MAATRGKPARGQQALSSAFIDLFGGGGDRQPPGQIRLFSKGTNPSDKGDFYFDETAAASVMADYKAKAVDLSIDYDHQALATPQVKAPAAGWFNLEVRDGELWATNIRWTPAATDHLRAAEYRYFSPLFGYDEKSGRITNLINLALTNTPALHGIDALVAASARTEDPHMDEELKKALARIVELEKTASIREERIRSLEGQTATAALSTTVGLAATASGEEVRTKVAALVTLQTRLLELTGKDSVPAALGTLEGWKSEAADSLKLKTQLETERLAALSADLKGILDKAGESGKVAPAERAEWERGALAFGQGKPSKDGNVWLSSRLDAMAPKVKGSEDGARPPGGTVALTATELEIAAQTGSDPERLKKYKAKKLGGAAS